MVTEPTVLRHSYTTTFFCSLLFLLLVHATPPVLTAQAQLERKTFTFGPFEKSEEDNFAVLKDARINGGALQLTPDTRNNFAYLQNKSGRVLIPKPFRLWDRVGISPRVASFNTTFVVNIYRDKNSSVVADGLAFVIAPDLSPPPPGSEGEYLGLTNVTTDGDESNHLVAVELDTFKQDFDPDNNHVGLDVNSVRSNYTTSLNSSGVVLSPVNATNNTVWIDYDGASRRVAVYVANEGSAKPSSAAIDAELDVSKYLLQDSYFGFAGSTGDHYQLNCVLRWELTVEIIPVKSDKTDVKLAVAIGVPLVVVAVVGAALGAWYVCRRKERLRGDEVSLGDRLKSLPGMPREFEYKELKKATGNFHEKNKLGQGSFGVVYKGKIGGDRREEEVAVKMFSKENTKMDDFFMELTIINRLRHRHLVRLFGWCYRKGKLLLVYEYMPKGGLDWHLYKAPPDATLPWYRRFNILVGVASAINYLHNEYEQKVVHRDLKASNILLDSQFNARLGDFGLARTIDPNRMSYATGEHQGVPGTMGYIAPECFHTAKATRESDVYGFGAVVLEVVCGRHPALAVGAYPLVDWVWMLHREGRILEAVDERLDGACDKAEAERLLLLALACAHPIAGERPKTEAILQMMSGSVPLPHVPPFRPAFVYPGTLDVDDGGNRHYSFGTEATTSTSCGGESSGRWTGTSPSGLTYVHSVNVSTPSSAHDRSFPE